MGPSESSRQSILTLRLRIERQGQDWWSGVREETMVVRSVRLERNSNRPCSMS